VVDRVQRQHERVIITRNGHDAAVVISPEDLPRLEETISVLSDPDALADIREADAAYDRGDVIRGVEAVRQLRRSVRMIVRRVASRDLQQRRGDRLVDKRRDVVQSDDAASHARRASRADDCSGGDEVSSRR
jgi:antitoxin YefM